MAETVVFLGPSLTHEEALGILPDARVLPPVRLGDVCAAVYQGADVIVIVDGYFEQVPTVWHKEVLWALSRGVWVYGAASMGALRAAELDAFGMRGVGKIYERFASGEYNDDDEVAIVHAPAEDDYRPLSVAMASVRTGLEHAVARGVLSADLADALCRRAKAAHYSERSWQSLLATMVELGGSADDVAALQEWLARSEPDAKTVDALAVLQTVRRDLADGFTPGVPRFDFESTYTFERLQTIVRSELAEESVRRHHGKSPADVCAELEHPHLPLFYLLVDLEANRLGLEPAPDAADADAVIRVMRQGSVPAEAAADFLRLESLAAQLSTHYSQVRELFTEAALCGSRAPAAPN